MKTWILLSTAVISLAISFGRNFPPDAISTSAATLEIFAENEFSPRAAEGAPPGTAPNATLIPSAIRDFDQQPESVQKFLRAALELAGRNLTYTYGSADPEKGGMDCSGTIFHLLKGAGLEDVPRSSSGQYVWLRKFDRFRAVLSRKENSFELDDLQPGDLLFWSGTYNVDRDPPITHTMIYLGVERKTGKRVMVGASNGRTYKGERRWGVSVFDFRMTRLRKTDAARALQPRFVGYASVPGIRD